MTNQPCDIQAEMAREGEIREQMAVYFLAVPPLEQQTEAQLKETRKRLRQLLAIENDAVIRAAGLARPLSAGDLCGMLNSLLHACSIVARQAGYPLSVHIEPGLDQPLYASFEPRLMQMAVVGLIRAACAANGKTPVTVSLYSGSNTITVAITGERPGDEEAALAVARETARLHGGSLAISQGTTGFSVRTTQPCTGGQFVYASSAELLDYMLSSVQVGLFSSLYEV